MVIKMNNKNCCKLKKRSEEEKNKIQKRLRIIEGQVRGVSGMIEENRYCDDVLIQIAAIDKSLRSLANEILKEHLNTCVCEEIKNNNTEVIDEVMKIIKRYM